MSYKRFLPSGSPTKILYATFLSPIHATCTVLLILLDLINQIMFGDGYKSFSSSLCNFLHSPVTSSLLDPQMLLNTPFSNTISSRFSRNVCDMDLYPYKTVGEIIFQYILIFIYFRSKLKVKILHRMAATVSWIQSPLNFFLKRIYTLSKDLWYRPAFWSRVMNMYLVLCLIHSL